MISITENNECCGCGACNNICPSGCIDMVPDDEGFLYPVVNFEKCIDCGLCEKVCLYKQFGDDDKKKPDCYAMKAMDNELRENSSSGGVFSLISYDILQSGGFVYGVSMDENNKSCSFLKVGKREALNPLRGSKYLQANAGEVYKMVKSDLDNGNKVLFSGVPCQIIALKMFLDKEYDNLYCVEVICHGVPSPLLWKKYIEYIERKNKTSVSAVNFRNKNGGWKNFSLKIDGVGFTQSKNISNDPYLVMFLRNYSLRPSCYNCKAKIGDSSADLTIADFWGIEKILPDMDDNKGVSLVMINTEKGRCVFENIKGLTLFAQVPYDFAVSNNTAYLRSCSMPKERQGFFKDLNSMDFEMFSKKYSRVSAYKKIKRWLSTVKKQLGL